jgi:hypothetical protein
MFEYFLKLKNCPKLGARARKLDKTEKNSYCPKLGAATLISDTEVFLKKRAQET